MSHAEPPTDRFLSSTGSGTFSMAPNPGYFRRRPLGLIALLPLIAACILVGCTRSPNSVDSFELLSESAKNRVQIAVDRYVTCSVDIALKLDKGRRNAGRLAWTASESCPNKKADIIRTMVEQGASAEAAFSYASDRQVQATAMGITAIQSRRDQ